VKRFLAYRLAALALAALTAPALAGAVRTDFDATTLAHEMARRPVVLLGEVHDNAAQHATRVAALRRLLEEGGRPAIAFEQFDRERQADIDRARHELPPAGQTLAEHVIDEAQPARGWNWRLYRPYVELALEYDLPIVAANLSRADAMKVATHGYAAVLDDATRARFGLDALPQAMLAEHERAVDDGHCNRMPADMLPALARAQIARDVVLAQSIRPYFSRGVVLLTGNGHARVDIGIPFFLTGSERAQVIAIGLLEDDKLEGDFAQHFDVAFATPVQQRTDPCAALPARR
jgi:uncharacterized iron-regulated protein